MVVGGVAFAISFLAIAIFGATHRGSSGTASSPSPSSPSSPAPPSVAAPESSAVATPPVPPPVAPASPWTTPPPPSGSAWTTLPTTPVRAPAPTTDPVPAPVATLAPPPPPPPPLPAPAPAPEPQTHANPSKVRSPPARAPATPSGRLGLLTVFCTPACDEVYDGGRALGASPVFKQLVSAGVHRLRLRVDATEKRVTVTVPEGETLVVRENVGD